MKYSEEDAHDPYLHFKHGLLSTVISFFLLYVAKDKIHFGDNELLYLVNLSEFSQSFSFSQIFLLPCITSQLLREFLSFISCDCHDNRKNLK